MSDDTPRDTPADDETQPVRPAAAPTGQPIPPPSPTTAAAPGAVGSGRRGFRDRFRRLRSSDGNRTFGLAALIASALAGVIVGGLGVTAVQAVTSDHDDRHGWTEQRGEMGRDGDDFGGRGPMHGGPPGVPGQVQPTTPPEDEGSAS
jgi:hypothetical protein